MKWTRTSALAAAAVAAVCLSPMPAAAEDSPIKGWWASGSAPQEYGFGTTQLDGMPGKCAFIESKVAVPSGFGSVMQEVSADNYRGQRLRLSARIKTKGADRAQLWMRVDGPQAKVLGFYNMQDKPVTGTTDWNEYRLALDVPPDAVDVAFGYLLQGAGTAWAKEFKLEPVGKDVPVSSFAQNAPPGSPANMDFEQ